MGGSRFWTTAPAAAGGVEQVGNLIPGTFDTENTSVQGDVALCTKSNFSFYRGHGEYSFLNGNCGGQMLSAVSYYYYMQQRGYCDRRAIGQSAYQCMPKRGL